MPRTPRQPPPAPPRIPEVWERLPTDDEDAWAAFVRYRNQEPPRRLERFGRATQQQMFEWFSVHDWHNRVMAWDNHISSVRQREIDGAHGADARAVAARQIHVLNDMLEIVEREIFELRETMRERKTHGLLRPGDISKWVDLIVKYQRLNAGQATERVDVDLSNLTLEQLRQLGELEQAARGGEK